MCIIKHIYIYYYYIYYYYIYIDILYNYNSDRYISYQLAGHYLNRFSVAFRLNPSSKSYRYPVYTLFFRFQD